jgi:ABC-type branched-subunit amino acid transport system ATPase component
MKIELFGWSSRGLRCPDVDVELTLHGKVAPVSLIQMPNGTGKTTTLDCLWPRWMARQTSGHLTEFEVTSAPAKTLPKASSSRSSLLTESLAEQELLSAWRLGSH